MAELNVTEGLGVVHARFCETGADNRIEASEPPCEMHPNDAMFAKNFEDDRQLGRLNFGFDKIRGQYWYLSPVKEESDACTVVRCYLGC